MALSLTKGFTRDELRRSRLSILTYRAMRKFCQQRAAWAGSAGF